MHTDLVAAATTTGRLLLHPVAELPRLAKGKGVRIISIPPGRLGSREEYVQAVAVLPQDGTLTVYAGKRHLTLKGGDLQYYLLGRGRRGMKLPRGLQRVDTIQAGLRE